MAYVIGQKCIDEKRGECVLVCPVDCIHPAPGEEGYDDYRQLFINPVECIDCEACFSACPVSAVMHEELVPEAEVDAIRLNAAYFAAPSA